MASANDLATMAHQPSARVHLGISDEPVDMPIDALVTTNRVLFVLNAGSNDISVIDTTTLQVAGEIGVTG